MLLLFPPLPSLHKCFLLPSALSTRKAKTKIKAILRIKIFN